MSLNSNPFYVLGAAPSDDRRRIVALTNDKRFNGDEVAVREARGVLITPRKRLKAEIAWLPGLQSEQICQVLTARDSNPAVVLQMHGLPALARANLLADGLGNHETATAEWIVAISGALERVRADEVTAAVNEDRLAAGIPMAKQQDVVEEIRDRRGHYRDAMERCLDGMDLSRIVMVMSSVVNMATKMGTRHAPSVIDSLVDSFYERKVREELTTSRNRIGTLVSQVRNYVGGGAVTGVPADLVGRIKDSVKYWDVLAQPIQVSLASRGMRHSLSNEVMHEVRSLAIDLVNDHGLFEVAQELTMALREAFAEMESITEILDKDLSTLDGFIRGRSARSARGRSKRSSPRAAAPAGMKRANSQSKWVAGVFVIGIIFAIYMFKTNNLVGPDRRPSGQTTGSPSFNQDLPGDGQVAPGVATQGPASAPTMDQASGNRFSMPSTGVGHLLDTSEVRWCLREEIRIETWRQNLETNVQVDSFNEAVDNYNARCGDYRYATVSMATARRDVEMQESEIVAQARRSPPWAGW